MTHHHIRPGERGAILFISLIILLIVTLIAISSTRISTTGQRISFNDQMKNTTFQAADSGLAMAEKRLAQTPETDGFMFTLDVDNPLPDQSISTSVIVEKTQAMKGSSLKQGAPKTNLYKITGHSEITTLNIRTELEAGYLKTVVGE